MPSYRHSQFATPMALATALGLGVAFAALFALSPATLAAAPWLVAALFAVLLGAFALFWQLTVEVDGTSVRAVFGVGLVRKRVPLADVLGAECVRTRAWWGYGVRWTPSGWLYNVAGRDAVRLTIAGGRPVMIGTDEPQALKAAIDAALAARGQPDRDWKSMAQDPNCIFCRIVRGEIPSRKVYEDDDVLAFHDIQPVAPVHLLLIPKAHVASLYEATEAHAGALGRMMALAGRLAREQGADDGFRMIVNTGRVGRQEVPHVHAHVIGGGEPLGPMIVRKGH